MPNSAAKNATSCRGQKRLAAVHGVYRWSLEFTYDTLYTTCTQLLSWTRPPLPHKWRHCRPSALCQAAAAARRPRWIRLAHSTDSRTWRSPAPSVWQTLFTCHNTAVYRSNVNTVYGGIHYRQDAAKRQTAGIKFTHRPKIRFFAQQGRLVALIHVKLVRADGHVGPLGCAKFHLYRHRGVGMRPPKYQKVPLFGKESPHRVDFLDRFLKFSGAFMRLTILLECFKFDVICFTGCWVIAEKPRVGQLGRFFPCTL